MTLRKPQKFEWHQVPSVLFFGLLIGAFLALICYGLHNAIENARASSSCTGICLSVAGGDYEDDQ